MKRVITGLFLSVSLSSCAQDTRGTGREAEIYLIPDGYVGTFYVLFGIPQGEPQNYEDGARVYKIPADGMLLMQSDANEGWIETDKIQFFMRILMALEPGSLSAGPLA